MSDEENEGDYEEPVEPMDEEREEENLLFEELEEAQRLREQGGDANGEQEQPNANDVEMMGLVEMREENQDFAEKNDEIVFDASEGPMAPIDAERVANAVRVTRPWLSKYERTRIIGTRATQLAMGATSTVECPDEVDPLRIAEKELAEFRVPLIVRRYLPDGSFEDWTVAEMNPQNRIN